MNLTDSPDGAAAASCDSPARAAAASCDSPAGAAAVSRGALSGLARAPTPNGRPGDNGRIRGAKLIAKTGRCRVEGNRKGAWQGECLARRENESTESAGICNLPWLETRLENKKLCLSVPLGLIV